MKSNSRATISFLQKAYCFIGRRLADVRKTSALFDVGRFVRGLEGAFLEMQKRALDGVRPEAFRVEEASLSQSTLNI